MNNILNLVQKLQISKGSYLGSLTNLAYSLHRQGSWLISKDITCFISFDVTGLNIKDSPYNCLFNDADLNINPSQILDKTINNIILKQAMNYPDITLTRLDFTYQFELRRIKNMINFPKLNRLQLIKKDSSKFLEPIQHQTYISVERNIIPPIFTIDELNKLGVLRYDADTMIKDTKNAAEKLIKWEKKANGEDDESVKEMYNILAKFGKEAMKSIENM